ncbi:MAG: hypothetical protein QOE86_3375 [Solirubrobacteraceae bacterium]|jgi:uncharacterized protein (TIGR02611 family)|nr:hypothetical protein [Solirubrobacteraceae bacterium]
MTEQPPRSKWADKLEERRARHLERGRIYRIAFTVLGVLVTVAGVAMLVTPGPAFVVIPIGLAMLAMEFAWAESALEQALVKAEKAQASAKDASIAQKISTALAVVLVVGAAVAGVFYWDVNVPLLNPAD